MSSEEKDAKLFTTNIYTISTYLSKESSTVSRIFDCNFICLLTALSFRFCFPFCFFISPPSASTPVSFYVREASMLIMIPFYSALYANEQSDPS